MTDGDTRSGSGDFTGQASEPQPIDWSALWKQTGVLALHDLGLNIEWEDIPELLAEFALDIAITKLIESGRRGLTVHELAVLRGITYEDGSWT